MPLEESTDTVANVCHIIAHERVIVRAVLRGELLDEVLSNLKDAIICERAVLGEPE